MEEEDECPDCNKGVLAHTALKCDGCEFWHHTACEKVEFEVYEFLCGHEDVKSLQWYCKRCSVTHLTVLKAILSMQAAQRKLEEKMDLMLSTMNDKNLVIDSLHKRAEESGKETQEIIGEIKQINHKIDEIVHSKSKKMLP